MAASNSEPFVGQADADHAAAVAAAASRDWGVQLKVAERPAEVGSVSALAQIWATCLCPCPWTVSIDNAV